jgi:hypothetical protein
LTHVVKSARPKNKTDFQNQFLNENISKSIKVFCQWWVCKTKLWHEIKKNGGYLVLVLFALVNIAL